MLGSPVTRSFSGGVGLEVSGDIDTEANMPREGGGGVCFRSYSRLLSSGLKFSSFLALHRGVSMLSWKQL